MRTINVLGEEVKIGFNLAVQIAYEDITGKAFSISVFNTVKESVALYFAAIIACNPDTQIDMQRLMFEATQEETAAIDAALGKEIEAWYHKAGPDAADGANTAPKSAGGAAEKHAERP